MSGEQKEIRFKFIVDEQSAQRVNRVLDEMIKRAETLAKTLSSVGGIGGGGGLLGGGSVGGRSPSAQSTMATASGSSTQKVSFASALTQNVDMFKKVAQEGGNAMKVLGDAVNRGAETQRREIFRLQGALDALVKTYDKLGGSGGNMAGPLQSKIMGVQSRIYSHQATLQKLQSMQAGGPELMPEVPWPEAAKPGMFQRFRGWANSGGSIGQVVNQIPGLGGISSLLSNPTALATAGLVASGAALKSQIQAAVRAPEISGQARLDVLRQGPTEYARKLRSGDLSDLRAMNDIQSDADKRREYNEINGDGSGSIRGNLREGGYRYDAIKAAFGRSWREGFDVLSDPGNSTDYQNIKKAKLREQLDRTIEERGVLEDIQRDASSGALGKMSTMRSLGIGDGKKKTGAYRSNAERFLAAYGQFDASEVVGAVQGIAGSGTRGAAYKNGLLSTVLQAQAGGIGGAANIGGVMSRQGGTAGSDFIDLLRSVAGAGTDVSTAGLLGGYVAQQADRSGIGGFGGGGLLGAVSYGTQGADGGMIARQNVGGMDQFQGLLSGTRDPAQKAQNFLLARRSAPDAGYYAQQYLATKLDASRIAEVMSGTFELTPEERNLGITSEMLTRQATAVQGSTRFRAMTGGFKKGSDPEKMLTAMQAGQDMKKYAMENFGMDTEDAVSTYATALRAGNESLSLKDAMGQARMNLYGLGVGAKKGKMIGDVAGGSFEAKVAKEEAEKKKTDLDVKDALMKELEDATVGNAEKYRRLYTSSQNLAITADTVATIIKNFSAALKAATSGQAGTTKVQPKK